ncbi:MAG: NAD-binding protein [Legionella sp.]
MVAELAQLVEIAESYRSDLNKKIHINLIENGPRVLAAFPERISRAVEVQLKKLGINVMLNTQVIAAEANGLRLTKDKFKEEFTTYSTSSTSTSELLD